MQDQPTGISASSASAANFQIVAVDQKSVKKIWPVAQPLLQRSYEHSDLEMPSMLFAELCWDKRKLWLIVEGEEDIIGAVLTAMYDLKSGKMLKIEHLSGERLMEWIHLRSEIERFAKHHGCGKVLSEARPGWVPLLPDYKTTAVIVEKRL